ncbi:MAG: hypothetical protein JKY15_02285 [Deltaproteobacteria bacterium]|nr:hypothetical protein [Deltaproteobacteria bacterium]
MTRLLVLLLSFSLSASNHTVTDSPNCDVSRYLLLSASITTLLGVYPLAKTWLLVQEKGSHAFEPINHAEYEEYGYYALDVVRVPVQSERHWLAAAFVPMTLSQILGLASFVDTYAHAQACPQNVLYYLSADLFVVSLAVKLIMIPFVVRAYRNHEYYEIVSFSFVEGFPVLAMLLGFIGFGLDVK